MVRDSVPPFQLFAPPPLEAPRALGPIEVLVVGLPGNQFTGEIIPELERLQLESLISDEDVQEPAASLEPDSSDSWARWHAPPSSQAAQRAALDSQAQLADMQAQVDALAAGVLTADEFAAANAKLLA